MTDAAAPPAPTPSPEEAAAVARRITRLSLMVATVLIAIKAFGLAASGSVSLLSSLTDSALDFAASLATFVAVRWAAAPADAEHRFGHGKAEALSALFQAGLILASAVFVGWEAVRRVFQPQPLAAGEWGVAVMLASIALTGWLVWMQGRALKRAGSMAVEGDRAHYASDLAANGVALIGVASATWLAAPGMDAAAGMVVAVWLAWGAVNLLRSSADHLLDRAAPDATHAEIVRLVRADPQVLGLHRLRTRMSGQALNVTMHLDLDAGMSLRDAHEVVEAAEARIRAAFPEADVIIHPDPHGVAAP